MRRRVKITGIGPVTPAGIGREAFSRGINEPVSHTREITRFDPAAGDCVAAEIRDFQLNLWLPDYPGVARRIPRQTQFALVACSLALADAGVDQCDLEGVNPVIITGSALLDPSIIHRSIGNVARKGPGAALPSLVSDALPSVTCKRIAEMLGVPCRTMCLQTACCAGMDAVGHGAELVARGQAEFVICCGTDAPIYYHPMLELGIADLSPRNATEPSEMGRPFDLWRNSGVIGEGAGAIILESEDSPRPALAWLSGYAYGHDTDENPGSGFGACMSMALANANCRPADVNYINAWGPGHITVDRAEAVAIKQTFQNSARIPVASVKGAIGNPLAAAGTIQIASAVISLSSGYIPPTVNWVTRDPECDLNLSGNARYLLAKTILINAHGMNGGNATVILERD